MLLKCLQLTEQDIALIVNHPADYEAAQVLVQFYQHVLVCQETYTLLAQHRQPTKLIEAIAILREAACLNQDSFIKVAELHEIAVKQTPHALQNTASVSGA